MLVHGSNLSGKEEHPRKYRDAESREYLGEIREKYDRWHEANTELKGPGCEAQGGDKGIVFTRVELLSQYKDFIDQQKYAENFDSRSNLHSSVIEEFAYYLFRDLVAGFRGNALIGRSHAFKDVFFVPPNFEQMVTRPYARIEKKDHDFVIGVSVRADLTCQGVDGGKGETVQVETHTFDIPAVVIECKTYLDKTMLEGSSNAAEQLKARNPNALYIVIMEWIKLTEAVNLAKYKVDQIYVFRKQKNTDRELRFLPSYQKNPIDPEVVWHLFEVVRNHLSADWEGGVEFGLQRGWLL